MRVLVIGGYGTFGGRLVDLLLDEPRLTLLVAGRSRAAAESFCSARRGRATLEPVEFDRAKADAAIATLRPDLVVDAAGPFQLYGGDPYAAARAALETGANWIDLADGIEFVAGIGALDRLAREKGLFALAGASSFPELNAAVVRSLAKGMPTVESIAAGVAPSPFAVVGANVVKAIASYAGQPLAVRQGGQTRTLFGLISSRTMTVNVPGFVPLRPTRFALVAVPDLEVLPIDWPSAATVWVGAGPTPAVMHRILWLISWLVRWRLLKSLVPLAPLMSWAVNTFRWGEHRGGMIVEVTGGGVSRSWHMLAEGDAGPFIPSMAIEAVIRKCLDGDVPAPGARSAHHALELADYEAMFARRGIVAGVREPGNRPLYAEALAGTFDTLPAPLRQLHNVEAWSEYEGTATVTGPNNPFAAAVAKLFRFPAAGQGVALVVRLSQRDGVETWLRSFAGSEMVSTQSLGRGRNEGLIVERFGPASFGMAVVSDGRSLSLVLRQWNLFGVPMPRALMPKVVAREHAEGGRFHFLVDIAAPLLGRLVRYEGWLVPALSSDPAHKP